MVPYDELDRVPSTISIRRMSAEDIPAALAILKESPEASMWSGESLWKSALQGIAWTAEQDGRVAGFVIGRPAGDEFEILNIAVARECRRRRIATRLVAAAVDHARTAGAVQAYLEVRASNEAGIALYTRLGFRTLGCRPNYYRYPTEDAILLVSHLLK